MSLSTNVADWASLGTVNLELGVAVSQHISLQGGVKYNPWEFQTKDPDMEVRNNLSTFDAGLRYWPWHVHSGWWLGAEGRFQRFERTGIWRPALEEATAIGGVLSAGYTLMVTKNINLEFGWGIWGGRYIDYVLYCCPKCLDIRESGPKNFIRPDNLDLSISFVF